MSLHCVGIFPVLRKLDGCMLVGSGSNGTSTYYKSSWRVRVRLWVQKTLGAGVTNIYMKKHLDGCIYIYFLFGI